MLLLGHQLGKYHILKTLGSGGFGTVYLVKDTWIDKKFAIKVPHKQNGEFDELLREPRLLAALDHENIVSIVTAEKADDYFFIVMEFVEGESLEARIQKTKGVELPIAIGFARQVATAVSYAHRQGVLHRDLRPGNVLVTPEGKVKSPTSGRRGSWRSRIAPPPSSEAHRTWHRSSFKGVRSSPPTSTPSGSSCTR
jgi:serine/threonine-protein kinase